MKNLLLILGIILIIACILSLLFAFINMQGYRSLRDGSAGLYAKLHRRMIIYFVLGVILAVTGILCIVFRGWLT